jgi:glycosyltransferase involved in cell wall biosynthesis
MTIPKLSVITLVYNQAPFLAERIRSVKAQTFQDFEWIVLDDCSTDNSGEILKRQLADVPQVKRLILHNTNRGVHFSFNEALSWCDGSYVYHAAGDDSCDAMLFEKSIAFLDAHPSIGFVHTAYRVIDIAGQIRRVIYPLNKTCVEQGDKTFARLALKGNFICSPSVTFHRQRYEFVGGMSNEWIYAGDYELWLKLSAQYDVGYIAEPLVAWRRLPQAISKRGAISPEGATEVYRVLNKVFTSLPPERNNLRSLYQPAIRAFSTSGMISKALWWFVYRRSLSMAYAMLKEANHYDPGVWSAPASYLAAIHHLVPRAIERLIKGQGGSMDFLPKQL